MAISVTRLVLLRTNDVSGEGPWKQATKRPDGWQPTFTARRNCRSDDPTPIPDLVVYRADRVITTNTRRGRRRLGGYRTQIPSFE
jgi:hypothetical protein